MQGNINITYIYWDIIVTAPNEGLLEILMQNILINTVFVLP
jgi:hypothetical protein